MNPDKLSRWLELARSVSGGDFWADVMEQPQAKEVINKQKDLYPAVDVIASDNEVIVLIDLPGVRKEDIKLSLGDGGLYIKGESRVNNMEGTRLTTERFQGEFERSIRLHHKINAKSIRASFHDGLLTVRFSKVHVSEQSIPID